MNAPGRSLVVGVDGRPATWRAVSWAAREAAVRSVPLRLVGVSRDAVEQARRIAVDTVPVVVEREVMTGPVAVGLVDRSRDAGLLVLGARTPDGMVDLSVGATTAHVLGDARCPVVVVPAAWDADRRHEGEVLVAVDPAGDEYDVVSFATAMALAWHRPVHAAVVLPGRSGAIGDPAAGRRFDEVLRYVEHEGTTIERVVRHGDPGEELLGLVGITTGLVVVGSRGHDASAPTGPGPTCEQVVRWARCPVAVVPGPRPTAWLSPPRPARRPPTGSPRRARTAGTGRPRDGGPRRP